MAKAPSAQLDAIQRIGDEAREDLRLRLRTLGPRVLESLGWKAAVRQSPRTALAVGAGAGFTGGFFVGRKLRRLRSRATDKTAKADKASSKMAAPVRLVCQCTERPASPSKKGRWVLGALQSVLFHWFSSRPARPGATAPRAPEPVDAAATAAAVNATAGFAAPVGSGAWTEDALSS